MALLNTNRKRSGVKTKNEYVRDRDIEALNHVLSTELGRWFFCRLMDRTGIMTRSFTGNSETFFKEGKRDVGISYKEDLERLGIQGVKAYHAAQLEYISKQQEFVQLEETAVRNGDQNG